VDGLWLREGTAPHPGPLPGGEGEDFVDGKQHLISNKLSGQRQGAVQPAQKCPLSLGERVGVRGMEQSRMRVGLMAVKGLSADTARRIVAQRGLRPFSTPVDFFQRVRPDEAEARALILCGALDGLAPALSRAQLLWTLAQWQSGRARSRDALPLFAEPAAIAPPELPPDDPQERLRREFRVLGFLCDRHPITLFRDAIKKAGAVPACEVGRRVGRRISFAGWLITGKVVHTKAGDPMEFLTFEDDTGIVETTFFPKAYERFCHMIDHNRPYLLRGEVEQNWGATTLTVSGVSLIS
jgi:error-prone DNA polymerase